MKKIALVTGGGRGIGAATSLALVKRGFHVVICSRTESELKAVADQFSDIVYRVVDLLDESAVRALFQFIQVTYGRLDVLVNNAAFLKTGSFGTMDLSVLDAHYQINVRSLALCSQLAFRMMAAFGGSIVNVASVSGLQRISKSPGMSAYIMSKFAVVGLTEALSVEGKPLGIRVNAIAPAAVNTVMLNEAFPHFQAATQPSDIAQSIVFLADPDLSGKLTGTILEGYDNDTL